MTPVFCCGFECGQLGSVGQHWTIDTGSPSISTTTKRTGDRALRINASASTVRVISTSLTASNMWVARFYINFTTLPNINYGLFFLNISGQNPGVYFNSSDSKIYPGNGTSGLGSQGFSVTTGVWYRVDVKINTSANPHLIDVSVDGNTLTQHSAAFASGTGTAIRIGDSLSSVTTDFFIDDVVISNTSGDYPINNGKVFAFIPTSDGSHNIAGTGDFQRTLTGTDILNATTTAYQLVDDVPLESGAGTDWINMVAPPNTGDYVECIFGPAPSVPIARTKPRAIEAICAIHQAGTGAGNMRVLIGDNNFGNSEPAYNASAVAGVTSVAYKRAMITSAGIYNNFVAGCRVRFGSPNTGVDANPDQYFDSVMLEVEFEEPKQKIIQVKQAVKRSSLY